MPKHKPRLGEAGRPTGEGMDVDEKREERRQKSAQYRRKPEVREKQRLLMAERRAAVKARRRQWDPPKKAQVVARKEAQPSLPPPSPANFSSGCTDLSNAKTDILSLTSAERFALGVLAEMSDARVVDASVAERVAALTIKYGVIPESPPPPGNPTCNIFRSPYANSDGVDSVLELAMQLTSISSHPPSVHSSAAAVQEEPVRVPWVAHPGPRYKAVLPAYASPATPLQKKLRHEIGLFGPLTPIQLAQIDVGLLTGSVSENEAEMWLNEHAETVGATSRLTTEGILRIWEWRQHGTYNSEWDWEARRGFAEATLRLRAL